MIDWNIIRKKGCFGRPAGVVALLYGRRAFAWPPRGRWATRNGLIVDVPTDLTRDILTAAIDVVKDDYSAEVAATVMQVQRELASHGVEAGAP